MHFFCALDSLEVRFQINIIKAGAFKIKGTIKHIVFQGDAITADHLVTRLKISNQVCHAGHLCLFGQLTLFLLLHLLHGFQLGL